MVSTTNPLYEGQAVKAPAESAASKVGQTALKSESRITDSIKAKVTQLKDSGSNVGKAVSNFFSKTIPGFAKGFVSRKEIDTEKKREGFVAKLESLIGKHKGDKAFEKTANNAINKLMLMSPEELNDNQKIQGLLKESVYRGEGLSQTAAMSVVRKITDASKTEHPSHLRKLSDNVKTVFNEVEFKPMTRLDRIKRAVVLKGSAAGAAITELFSKVTSKTTEAPKEPDPQGFLNAASKITPPPKGHYGSKEYKDSIHNFLGKMKESLGFKESSNKVNYGGVVQKGFKVEIDPAKTYTIGESKISGKRLQELQKETQVSVDTSRGGSSEQTAAILKNGSQNLKDRLAAGAKIVSSTEILMMGADDKPLKANDNSPTFKAYTVSAPNVAYDAEMKAHFSGADGKLDVPKWKAEIKGILKHMLTMMRADGVKNAVIPALGLGAFMTNESRNEAAKAFTEALNEVVEENNMTFDSIHLTGSQFDNIDEDLKFRAVGNGVSFAGDKDSFAILQAGLENGVKMGVAVAGDPSGQAGQMVAAAVLTNSPPGHIAQEEAFAVKVPTFMLNQNYGANPEVANTANYQTV